MIKNNLKEYAGLLSGYSELRLQENRHTNLSLMKGNLVMNESRFARGISARACRNGAWGFASAPGCDAAAVKKALAAAFRNADFLDSRLKRGLPQLPASKAEGSYDLSTQKPRLSQKELVEFAREADAYIDSKYKGLSGRRVSINNLDMEKAYLNSYGSSCYSLTPRTALMVSMFTLKDGETVNHGSDVCSVGQFEDIFSRPADLFPWIDSIYEALMLKASGVYPEAGRKECILDASLAGILAHEAVGHTTEADLVQGGSIAGQLMGQQVAAPMVNLTDFAHTALGKPCHIPIRIDDEGVEARDAEIIKDGVLTSYMHNRESALEFGAAPTGNARASQFSDEPLIRMRNTAILPGKDKLEDMIASVQDGYYLAGWTNGQADSTSEFTFGVKGGYEIKGGKLARPLRGATVSGLAFDVLKTVTMLSADMNWSALGMCGKKQSIPAAMGGPAVKCLMNIGGR
ncbi:MAG TPA: peptidase [Elusimicrobia bacterium]|nr:MAG: peptidase [Elusimicrobia bacterium GWD2_63_28]HBB67848.1 peptidase [Elusimicrobiota bacterium]HCC47167.1 peptidase [Elusimicrobiota bacterium]